MNYNYNFIPMTIDYANQIKEWKYEGPMEDIDMEPYFESNEKTGEMKGPGGCDGFAVLLNDQLIGLFEYYFTNGIMSIGLALNPIMVGKGLGKDFVLQGLNFGITKFNYRKEYIKLSVNVENKAAIRVYEKVGFKVHTKDEDEIQMRIYL